jgi:hypothetical protein
MDPQIHGAIVGGAIGGLTVVLGVGVEWSVTRLRDHMPMSRQPLPS